MKPAGERLEARLANVAFNVPAVPVVQNVDAKTHSEPSAIRAALARQAASPVRWVETIQSFAERGVTQVIECGPGRVLTGMTKRIDRSLKGYALDAGADIDATIAALADSNNSTGAAR
jgi:[acyl-carrier-protein] S-malonyltransferase